MLEINLSPIQDWHAVILSMLAAVDYPISPQHQPNIKQARMDELESIGCVKKSIGKGKTQKIFVYEMTELGAKYHEALKLGTLTNVEMWYLDVEIASLYLAYGDIREAIPYIVDGLNNHEKGWRNSGDRLHILNALKASDNGYAHMIVDAFKSEDCNLSWVKPETSLIKRREAEGEIKFETINFQLSPLAEEAFGIVNDYIKSQGLRTHRQSGVASKGLAGEYALILAASLIKGCLDVKIGME